MEVSFFGSYQSVLHKLLVTTKGAAESVCRPCVNRAETLYNNTLYAISTERLVKRLRRLNYVDFKDITKTKFYISLQQKQQQ